MTSLTPPRLRAEAARYTSVGEQADQQARADVAAPTEANWRAVARDSIKQSLATPERTAQKKASEQQAKSSSFPAVRPKPAPQLKKMEETENINTEGQHIVAVSQYNGGSGQNSSGGQDDEREDSQSGYHHALNQHGEAPFAEVDGSAEAAQVDADPAQQFDPRTVLARAFSSSGLAPAPQRVHIHADSAATLIEALLADRASHINLPTRLSQSKAPLAQPKANARERRRIQQAFAVTDSITIIAIRTAENNPDQYQSRSLFDALIDLLCLLIDLLAPVAELVDPAARRAAWLQLSQLAFMTSYTGKLKITCEKAMSMLEENDS